MIKAPPKDKFHVYRACGLCIHAALSLPELVSDTRAPDVVVRFGEVIGLPLEARDAKRYVQATPEGIYLAWRGVGAFLVRKGREIIIDPAPGVQESILRLPILGVALAMLLHQRGNMVLHASAVAVEGQAAVFIGEKGAGKSTMAAALLARAHALVADDILALAPSREGTLALPGFPQLKLWPDAVTSLGYDPEELPYLYPDGEIDKRGQRLTTGFVDAAVPISCVYVLDHGPIPEIELLPSQEALMTLMPHWYGARFGTALLQSLGLSSHFLQCATLVNHIPVFRLKRPTSLTVLPQLAKLVEDHIQTLI